LIYRFKTLLCILVNVLVIETLKVDIVVVVFINTFKYPENLLTKSEIVRYCFLEENNYNYLSTLY